MAIFTSMIYIIYPLVSPSRLSQVPRAQPNQFRLTASQRHGQSNWVLPSRMSVHLRYTMVKSGVLYQWLSNGAMASYPF